MNQKEAEILFYNTALSQAVALGFRFGEGAGGDLQRYAKDAAAIIFDPLRSKEERDTDIERAVRSFRLLVDTMIGVRREAYVSRPEMLQGNIIGEDTLRHARDILCPGFWPFC